MITENNRTSGERIKIGREREKERNSDGYVSNWIYDVEEWRWEDVVSVCLSYSIFIYFILLYFNCYFWFQKLKSREKRTEKNKKIKWEKKSKKNNKILIFLPAENEEIWTVIFVLCGAV